MSSPHSAVKNKPCTNCRFLRQEIKSLTQQLEEERAKAQAQQAADHSKLQNFERMYHSLRRSHDELIEEFKHYSQELSHLDSVEHLSVQHSVEVYEFKAAPPQ